VGVFGCVSDFRGGRLLGGCWLLELGLWVGGGCKAAAAVGLVLVVVVVMLARCCLGGAGRGGGGRRTTGRGLGGGGLGLSPSLRYSYVSFMNSFACGCGSRGSYVGRGDTVDVDVGDGDDYVFNGGGSSS
jgi:hypothetical protein